MSSARPRDRGCTLESPAITSGSTATVAGCGGWRASSASRASACRAVRSGAERELRLGAQGGHASGVGVLRRKVAVGGDRLVVAIRLLLARADHERPEHIVRLKLERRARYDDRRIAAAGGGERRAVPKRCDSTGLWSASAGDGCAQQKRQELQLHRRDFFFAAFFLTSAFGLTARTGLDLRGPSTSPSTRSPSSGPIKPRRTA